MEGMCLESIDVWDLRIGCRYDELGRGRQSALAGALKIIVPFASFGRGCRVLSIDRIGDPDLGCIAWT